MKSPTILHQSTYQLKKRYVKKTRSLKKLTTTEPLNFFSVVRIHSVSSLIYFLIAFFPVQIAAWEAMDPDDRPQNFLPKKLVVVFFYSVLNLVVEIFSS